MQRTKKEESERSDEEGRESRCAERRTAKCSVSEWSREARNLLAKPELWQDVTNERAGRNIEELDRFARDRQMRAKQEWSGPSPLNVWMEEEMGVTHMRIEISQGPRRSLSPTRKRVEEDRSKMDRRRDGGS